MKPAVTADFLLRLGSALVLAAAALFLTYSGIWTFLLLVCVSAFALCWEWGQLVRGGSSTTVLTVHFAAVATGAVLAVLGWPLAAFTAVAAGSVAAWMYSGRGRTGFWSALGVVYFGLPAASLVMLRASGGYGWHAILFLFVVVWCADTAAYLVGRNVGGPKLTPRISPSKTWSGLAGGIAVPALAGYVFGAWYGNTSAVALAGVATLIAAAAQAGDLSESAIKRVFHVKDSSRLIPGHGGLLDRVDGFLFAAVLAVAAGAARAGADPAYGLLIWP